MHVVRRRPPEGDVTAMPGLFRCILALGLALGVAACDEKAGPTTVSGPSSLASPAPSPTGFPPLRIVSGANNQPVSGAVVVIEGNRFVSDENGEVPFDAGGGAIDVDAQGFLPRRTRVDYGRHLALWPVADEAEAEAVREMVYGGGREAVLQPPGPGSFLISFLGGPGDGGAWGEIHEAWTAAASAFGARFGIGYVLSYEFQYELNEVGVTFREAGGCVPVPAWGFCRDSPHYRSFSVLPERSRDGETIRRILASWFLRPNPLPGLLNAEAPASELSPLEEQTIRMILLRRQPNRWPDDDR